MNGSIIHDDGRIPPDGQESAALLKNQENCIIPGCGLNNATMPVVMSSNGNNGTLKLSWDQSETVSTELTMPPVRETIL